MQELEADGVSDLVQASASESLPADRLGPGRSCTEQARFIAGYYGWSMNGDAIQDHADAVALYIEDLATALTELGWIAEDGIRWDDMPFAEHEAGDALRAVQRAHGWDV